MNSFKIKALIVKHGDTIARLADAMGLPASALSQRVNGKIDFRRSEILFIKRRYGLSAKETDDIFFEDVVSA
ncbi:MAG: helix-turn-helix transcriptional regulator [Parasporobacterium sp.]|nr:helix-turn-helix transcriptional regulator [Parasporobacterium sp.]